MKRIAALAVLVFVAALTGCNIFYDIPADCEAVDQGWFQEPAATNCSGI